MDWKAMEITARSEQLVADWHLLRTVGRIRVRVLAEKMGPHITACAADMKAAGLALSPAMRVLVKAARRGRGLDTP